MLLESLLAAAVSLICFIPRVSPVNPGESSRFFLLRKLLYCRDRWVFSYLFVFVTINQLMKMHFTVYESEAYDLTFAAVC